MPRGKAKNRDGIYTRKDRPGYWGSWIDASGKRRQRKFVAHTLQQARTLLNAEKARVEKTVTLGYAPPSAESFVVVSQRFLKHQQARLTPRSYTRESGIMEAHLKPFFGTGKVADIRRVDVQKYITHRSGNVSSASVVKELNVLKHLLGLAVEWELIPTNSAHGVKPPRVPAGRVRYLQPTELREVLEACPVWLRPIAGLAAATGMRRGEILGLRWMDVDSEGKRIMLPQTKNGDGRIVYLNTLAIDALAAVPVPKKAKSTDCIFSADPINPENVSVAFLRACRLVKISDFRFHDLRHTAASWMRMKGADIHTVALILGHKDLRMAARYQHLSPAFLSDAVNLLDGAYAEKPKEAQRETAKEPQEEVNLGSIVTAALPAPEMVAAA
ncbi:MAG: site-specific integrase [Acidobacteriota bacterium]|nr:site-specific integrase [Acidobacteriota bacterium]